METVTLVLTKDDADAFKRYRKHQDFFIILDKQGAFDIQFGKCTMNFAGGILQNIIKEEVVWRR